MKWTSFLHLAQASLVLGLLSAWLTALLQHPLNLLLDRLQPKPLSSRFWFGWGMLPAAAGAAVALFGLAFGTLSGAGWLEEHCRIHPGHPHLCLSHISDSPPGGLLVWAFLSVSSLTAFWRLRPGIRQLLALREWLNSALARPEPGGGEAYLLPGSVPTAFAAGILAPRVFWTRSAWRLMDDTERRIVFLHEKRHCRDRDPMRAFLLHCCRTWLPGGGRIVRNWTRRREIECDRACLEKGFPPRVVASTILKLQRAAGRSRAATLSAAYSRPDREGLKQRVEALFAPPRKAVGVWPAVLPLSLLSGLLVCKAPFAHHLLETLLGWMRL